MALPVALVPALMSKPVYQGQATIALEKPAEVVTFGQGTVAEEAFSDRRNPLGSTTAVMTSGHILGNVIDQLPEQGEDSGAGLFGWVKSLGRDSARIPASIRRHLRIESLRERVEVEDAGGGSVAAILVEDTDPTRASFLANAIADAFIDYDRDRRRSSARTAQSWLTRKESELRGRIRERHDSMDEIVDKLGRVPRSTRDPIRDGERNELIKGLEEARAQLLWTDQRLAELAPVVKPGRQAGEGASTATRSYYLQLKQQLAQAEATLTPNHPRLKRLRRSVADLQEKIGSEPVDSSDPLVQESLREYERLRSERAGIQARVDSIGRSLEGLDGAGSVEAARYARMERESEMDLEMLREIQARLSSTLMSAAKDQARARVLDYAVVPVQTAGKRRKLLVLAIGAALALSIGGAALAELLDRSEHDSARAASSLSVQVVATIPQADPESMKTARAALEYTTPVGEAFRRLRTSLIYSGVGTEIRTLVVASAVAGEGKTTISTNLAASFAQTGRRVLIVDADMRRPRVNEVLSLSRGPGLSEILRGRAKASEVTRSPKIYGADVITSGEIPTNPTDLLSGPAPEDLLQQLVPDYDLIILDAPVLMAVSDALLIASIADGVLIVNKPGAVERGAFGAMSTELKRVGARVLGLVANQVEQGDTYSYPSYLQSPYVSSKRSWFDWRRLGRRT